MSLDTTDVKTTIERILNSEKISVKEWQNAFHDVQPLDAHLLYEETKILMEAHVQRLLDCMLASSSGNGFLSMYCKGWEEFSKVIDNLHKLYW